MNVKKGDLAIVISVGHSDWSDWVGRIVEILEFEGVGPFHNDFWRVKFAGALPQSLSHTLPGHCFYISDSNLRPVSGLPDADTVETSKPVDLVPA